MSGQRPLDLIERMFLETPGWWSRFDVQTQGPLDPWTIRQAVKVASTAHPRSQLLVSGAPSSPTWAEAPAIDVIDVDSGVEPSPPLVDLRQLGGLRVNLDADRGRLLLDVHHAVTDGAGSMAFLRSLAAACTGDSQPAHGAEPAETPMPSPLTDPRVLDDLVRELVGLETFGRPGLLGWVAPRRKQTRTSSVRTIAIPATSGSFTAVERIVAAVHDVLASWSAAHGHAVDRIGVAVPIDVRPLRWRGQGLCNRSLAMPLLTWREERADPGTLVSTIAMRLRRLRDRRRLSVIHASLAMATRLPLWARLQLSQSAIVSCLPASAAPASFGENTVTSVAAAPPTLAPVDLAIGHVLGSGQATIRTSDALVSPDRWSAFHTLLVDRLATYAQI